MVDGQVLAARVTLVLSRTCFLCSSRTSPAPYADLMNIVRDRLNQTFTASDLVRAHQSSEPHNKKPRVVRGQRHLQTALSKLEGFVLAERECAEL